MRDARVRPDRMQDMNVDVAMLVGAVVALMAIAAARLGARAGLPALLLFLLVGMVTDRPGFGLHLTDPVLARQLGFAALVIILAEGGLTTRWRNIRPAIGVAVLLATSGLLVGMVLFAAFAHFVLGLPPVVALLFGAITAPTDSAAVFSVLRNVNLPTRVTAALEAESGLNDAPTVLIVGVATSIAVGHGHGSVLGTAGLILVELVGGLVLGLVVGMVAAFLMKRIHLPSSGLYAIGAFAWAITAYGLGVVLHLSGFAAVYVCAVVLGNAKLPYRHAVRSFAEGLGWMAQIGLFVMLGLLASPGRITLDTVVIGIVAGLFLTFVARPVSVWSSAVWFRIPWREQVFLSWAGLRGAVPIILCTIPLAARMPGSEKLFDIVLVFVIVFTVVQSPTLPWVGHKLGLINPEGPTDVDIEVAPLDRLRADLMQIRVPKGSHLAGVSVTELRLPRNAVVSLIIRDNEVFAPAGRDQLREGDELMVLSPHDKRTEVERRFTVVGRGGRLARWKGVRADEDA